MSRAFVKEGDGEELDAAPPRPPRVQPCYMTAGGVAALREELENLQRDLANSTGDTELTQQADHRRAQRRVHELMQILHDAVPVAITDHGDDVVRFGTTVELLDEAGNRHVFQIVGEDETAPASGRISWVSPLGRRLIGKAVGDVVTWTRPNGALELEIVSLSYIA